MPERGPKLKGSHNNLLKTTRERKLEIAKA